MLKRFLCWLLGHKTIYKGYFGETVKIDTAFDKDQVVPVLKWERSSFCLRCGKPVHTVVS
ncbi:MAG TPA: hypothetical protein VMV84_03845 [Dehalococcoidales bacterium]|nr:hypothetical protein [Dehalococcoidales bacterium]